MDDPGVDGIVELTATSMAAGGDAIAREPEGRVVFVAGALPGERVRVRITQRKRDFARGSVVDVLEASADRVAPPCRHLAAGCGGCGWQHVEAGAQRRLKEQIVVDSLRRTAHLADADVEPTVALAPDGYRTTIRLAVDGGGRLGFRRFHGHEVVGVDSCLVAHPLVAGLLPDIRVDGAEEVVVRCGARTGDRLVHVTPAQARVDVPDGVRVSRPGRLAHLSEAAAGRTWRVTATSFFQARPDGADALAAQVVRAAGDAPVPPATAVDLFAGVGLFAGALADLGLTVVAVEGAASAADDAAENLAGDDARVFRGDANRWRGGDADLVVADPSRSGLGARGVEAVVSARPVRVVLVSCDPAALGRDARLLAERGYALRRVTPVDLFPQTPHVEAVAVFDETGGHGAVR